MNISYLFYTKWYSTVSDKEKSLMTSTPGDTVHGRALAQPRQSSPSPVPQVPNSQHIIFLVTYKWAQQVRVLNNSRLEKLAIKKCSGLLGPFVGNKENKVLWMRLQVSSTRTPMRMSNSRSANARSIPSVTPVAPRIVQAQMVQGPYKYIPLHLRTALPAQPPRDYSSPPAQYYPTRFQCLKTIFFFFTDAPSK